MIDRTKFSAQGLKGGEAGGIGAFRLDGEPAPPKTILWMEPDAVVSLDPPGGGGYGDPLERDPQLVLEDVINGYVTIKAARERYGVAVEFTGSADALVRLPEDYQLIGRVNR